MNTKEWLKQFLTYRIETYSLAMEIDTLSKISVPCDDLIEELERWNKQYKLLVRIVDNIEDPVARPIFKLRYICCFSWEEIARRCRMSKRNVCYIHNKALSEVERIYRNLEVGDEQENSCI